MVTREQIMATLARVPEPEIRKSLVELNMIKDVAVDGSHVTVTIKLTTAECPWQNTIRHDVEAAVARVDGVEKVSVVMDAMTDDELAQLVTQLRGDGAASSPLLQPDSPTEVIAIASGKGGVGKSTVAVNLAVALAERGHDVGLMDCDIYGFSVPGMMDIQDLRPALIGDLILPVSAFGVRVISMEFFLAENRPVIWRGPMLGKMLHTFFDRVYWGDLDYLIMDLPPGTGDVALDVHRLLPRSREIIVTTPHPTATHVAYRAAKMALDTEHEIIGVVENMSSFRPPNSDHKYEIFGHGGGAALSRQLNTPLLAQLPLGNPMRGNSAIFAPGTEAHGAFLNLAAACERITARHDQ